MHILPPPDFEGAGKYLVPLTGVVFSADTFGLITLDTLYFFFLWSPCSFSAFI
jgi:hypothetical protein